MDFYNLCRNFRFDAVKEENILGKPSFGIYLEIVSKQTDFTGTLALSVENEIKRYGMAIDSLQKSLLGSWTVTDRGYLVRGVHFPDKRNVIIDVSENLIDARKLAKIRSGKLKPLKANIRIHFYFKNGAVGYIGIDKFETFYIESLYIKEADERLFPNLPFVEGKGLTAIGHT